MKIFIHSGTHWDREWYQTFQGFRYRLVSIFSEVIEQLELHPEEIFHTDGQTVMLEDFLEIRPDWFERLKKLIQNGQIIIGPWYDMPDEFLLSGESLIRNLRRGMKISREQFGVEPCKNAYINDIFGHTCQTPQIFKSLGFNHTVLGRGLNDKTTPPNFRWQALDGSEVIGYQLRDYSGYLDFTQFVWDLPADITDEELDVRIKKYFDELIKMSGVVPIVTSFDAGDHTGYRYDTARYLASLKRVYPDAEIYQTSIDRMNESQNEYVDLMPVRVGELNETTKGDGYYKYLITNTLSSRYPIKKYNDCNQTLLEKWAGPMYGLHLTEIPFGFMDIAEKNLLLNHPHDSICGCSIDQVHRDMMYRFDQTRMIAEQIIGSTHGFFSRDLTKFAVTDNKGSKNEMIIRLFNPLPFTVKKNIDARLWFDNAFPRFEEFRDYEVVAGFRIYDADGNEIPYGITNIHDYNEYFVNFDAELTACGITEYKIVPSNKPTRYPQCTEHSTLSAKGDYIGIKFNIDGTFDLTDFETGEKYENLLTVLDDAEIGDGWFHFSPKVDRIYTATSAQIGIVEHNCNRIVFEVTQSMMLPTEIRREHGIHRSYDTAEFNIKHRITLAIHDKFLNIETEIDNNIKDHRLKIRFPSGINTPTYFSAQPFGRVERKCGEDYNTDDWKEYGCAEKQTQVLFIKQTEKEDWLFFLHTEFMNVPYTKTEI